MVDHVTTATFEAEVLKSDKPVLIDFYADWCGPCKALAPILEEYANENPDVKVVKINIEDPDAVELVKSAGVRSIPTMYVFNEGKPLAVRTGGLPKAQLAEWVKQSVGGGNAPSPQHRGPKGPGR